MSFLYLSFSPHVVSSRAEREAVGHELTLSEPFFSLQITSTSTWSTSPTKAPSECPSVKLICSTISSISFVPSSPSLLLLSLSLFQPFPSIFPCLFPLSLPNPTRPNPSLSFPLEPAPTLPIGTLPPPPHLRLGREPCALETPLCCSRLFYHFGLRIARKHRHLGVKQKTQTTETVVEAKPLLVSQGDTMPRYGIDL